MSEEHPWSLLPLLHLGKYFPPEPGGIEYVLKSLLDATGKDLFHYCLVADRSGPSRTVKIPGGVVHFLKERGTILLAPILPSLPLVLHRLRRGEEFPIVMLHYPNPTAVAALALSLLVLRKREKIVVWYHADVLLEERWKRFLYCAFRPLEEFLFRRADAFVAATPKHLESSQVLSRYRDRTTIIPFAVPNDWFEVSPSEMEEAHRVRERLGDRYLLFVGRLVSYKGLDTLVEAAGMLPVPVVIVGTGPLEGYLRREIASRGLSGRLVLMGGVRELKPYYLGCEFLVLPSSSVLEAFGIVQIEAMALGKPVVSSDLPTGVTWVNRHGETGLTFPVGDAAAFASACRKLLGDQDLRYRLGKTAEERVRREFSYKALEGEFVNFLRGLKPGCGSSDFSDLPEGGPGRIISGGDP